MKRFGVVFLILFMGWLTACSSPVEVTFQSAESTATAVPLVTFTASPVQLSTPNEPALPSAILTPTAMMLPGPTPTAVPLADFSALRVVTIESNAFGWMIQFNLPGIKQPLNLKLDNKEYRCGVDERYPERLFCQGLAKPLIDQPMKLVFFNPESGAEVYRSNLIIPLAFVVPPTPVGYLHTACEERGKQVSCETECRIDPDGNPCIVATCTDACGPYFAVHSCPDDMPLPSPSCTAEQWVMMKKRYQIP
ncbi:hypothetical protein [Bellilinea sp.]|jgi:hypothetical protein|uniref:Uncharacterized protein n=1 Tax=Bellilinea caldifistulae TaxID=360411 RepID=A0A7C4L1A2_9CHLR